MQLMVEVYISGCARLLLYIVTLLIAYCESYVAVPNPTNQRTSCELAGWMLQHP